MDSICIWESDRSQFFFEISIASSLSHCLLIMLSLVLLSVNNKEYISDIKRILGSDLVQITSNGVRYLHQLESGLELLKKCLICRYLKKGIFWSR